jgi:hypothetical protein
MTASLLIMLTAGAQTIHIHQTNGAVIDIPSKEVAYINFTSYQEDENSKYGTYKALDAIVQDIYQCIPHKESCAYCTTFNWGDDEIMNGADYAGSHLTPHFDQGDYAYWYNMDSQNWLSANLYNNGGSGPFGHSLAKDAWNCINNCNLALSKLNVMVGTDEERDLLKGQLLFFRAWWHQQMMEWWGGIPYVDQVMEDPYAYLNLPRLSFKECAEKCAADYSEAAQLLPEDWNLTQVSHDTSDINFRITKFVAMSYQGKVLLWAASPLWANAPSGSINGNAQTGALKNGNTYKYDVELATRAADILGEVIKWIERGQTIYSLVDFKYTDIYNHERDLNYGSSYSDIFYTVGNGWQVPGSTEAMMRGTNGQTMNQSNWNFTKLWGPKVAGLVPHDAIIHMPTANYVNYAYGMANGEPILLADGTLNPNSGFDPAHPYKDRDPRFYHDIVFDGFKYVNNTDGLSEVQKQYQYMELFTGGNMVPTGDSNCENLGSRTGYFCQKLVPHQCNEGDRWYDYGTALQCYLPYLRVAEVYLLYAEAAAAAGGASYKVNCSCTAEGAINVLRNRVGAGPVAARFVADKNLFLDEVRRERACELAFEGFRWQDLQRWLLLTEYPYNVKTREEFTRSGSYNYKRNDPRNATVAGFDPVIANGKQTVIVERNYDVKHYLLPFNSYNQTFVQNPGW